MAIRKSILLDEFWCLGHLYTIATLAEYISALQMTHSENETVEGCPGVHLFILFQQWEKNKSEFQVSKQSSGTQKHSMGYPGDVLLSWAPRPGRGWQATVQAFEFQPGPQSVAKSSATCLTNILHLFVSPKHWCLGNRPAPATEDRSSWKDPWHRQFYCWLHRQSLRVYTIVDWWSGATRPPNYRISPLRILI